MKINEIHTLYNHFYLPDCRTAAKEFAQRIASDYQIAITLTLKEKWYYKNGGQKIYYYSNSISYEHKNYIYNRFEWQLNKLIWRHKFYRHKSEQLNFFKVWENGKGTKHLHFHGAIGNFPPKFQFNQLPALIEQASRQCCEIDFQHKEDICDSGWLGYITKEVDKGNTDNILW